MNLLHDPAFLGWVALTVLGSVILLFTLLARWFITHPELRARWIGVARQHIARFPPVLALRRRFPRAWGFVAARLSRQEYLGLHLTLGLLVSVAALAGFVGIVDNVAEKEDVARLDEMVLRWLHANVNPPDLTLMKDMSLLGAPLTVAVLAAVVAGLLLWKRERVLLLAWSAALVGGGVLDWLLKQLFRRARPEGAGAFLHGKSWSFTSGHAMGSLIVYGMLAYFVCLRLRTTRARVGVVGLAMALVLTIGFTRLYLGVHYFTDVIGGFCAGLVWLAACVSGAEAARQQHANA